MKYCQTHNIAHGEISCPLCDAHDRIAEIEQQLKDANTEIESLRGGYCFHTGKEQIQQAEKRGYDMHAKYGLVYYDSRLGDYHERTYEEAVQERDGGAK